MLEPAKRYTGYTAYEYLERGKDYRDITYAKQIGRVPPYQGLELSDAQLERTKRLLTDEVVISLHEHVQVFPDDMSDLREHIRQGREPTGYEGLSRSGMTAVFDNGMDGTCCISSDSRLEVPGRPVRPRRTDGGPRPPGLRRQGGDGQGHP